MNKEDYEILLNTMPPTVKTIPDFAVRLLEDTCAATGLDWKRRHVYLMQRGGKWGVTLSIDGFRTVGAQHPDYGGQEGPFWVTAPDGAWTDVPPEGKIYAAKVGIKNKSGVVTYGVAKFADYAAGPMWNKFPSTMSAKCAEMLAWRKAFPGALGGLYGTEEMEQASGKGSKAKAPEPAANGLLTGVELDTVKNDYIVRMAAAPDMEALKALGVTIQADKTLPPQTVLELSAVFQARKARL